MEYNKKAYLYLKRGLWLYLILLIFEGGLRKWVLPGLSNPLLIIRDPLAIWLLFIAAKYNIIYGNTYTKFIVPYTLVCAYIALLLCHHYYVVALFGSRITILHFPLIFLMAKVFNRDDIEQMGKFLLYLTLPMTVLLIVQFYSPQSSFVNRGVGGNVEGGGFAGAEGYFRPPTTFSFISGTLGFYTLVAPFIFYFLFYSDKIKKYVVYSSLMCILLAIPFSISRSLFFGIIISLLFAVISFKDNVKQLNKILGGILVILTIFYLASNLKALETSFFVFTSRFTTASEQEGGLSGTFLDRVIGGSLNGIIHCLDVDKPFWGLGLGYGTNVASKLLTNGDTLFLVDENEWGRIMGELGPLLGLMLIFIRVRMTVEVTKQSYAKLQMKDPLPWLLLGNSFLLLLQASWSTPTTLGFYVISAGLSYASLRSNDLIAN